MFMRSVLTIQEKQQSLIATNKKVNDYRCRNFEESSNHRGQNQRRVWPLTIFNPLLPLKCVHLSYTFSVNDLIFKVVSQPLQCKWGPYNSSEQHCWKIISLVIITFKTDFDTMVWNPWSWNLRNSKCKNLCSAVICISMGKPLTDLWGQTEI